MEKNLQNKLAVVTGASRELAFILPKFSMMQVRMWQLRQNQRIHRQNCAEDRRTLFPIRL